MAKIVIDNNQSGEDRFFNLSVNSFLQENYKRTDKSFEQFKKSFYSDTTRMYLIGLEDKYCEIVVINKSNDERYFRLDIDSNMHIKDIKRISNESELSAGASRLVKSLQRREFFSRYTTNGSIILSRTLNSRAPAMKQLLF